MIIVKITDVVHNIGCPPPGPHSAMANQFHVFVVWVKWQFFGAFSNMYQFSCALCIKLYIAELRSSAIIAIA